MTKDCHLLTEDLLASGGTGGAYRDFRYFSLLGDIDLRNKREARNGLVGVIASSFFLIKLSFGFK